mmetsp:Transcript_19658/g.36941  ORF Transcript_19658/g.36941 Transcript_19658/m.36941 type:complete len:119 (-) Transcript_19658:579-935(-)
MYENQIDFRKKVQHAHDKKENDHWGNRSKREGYIQQKPVSMKGRWAKSLPGETFRHAKEEVFGRKGERNKTGKVTTKWSAFLKEQRKRAGERNIFSYRKRTSVSGLLESTSMWWRGLR